MVSNGCRVIALGTGVIDDPKTVNAMSREGDRYGSRKNIPVDKDHACKEHRELRVAVSKAEPKMEQRSSGQMFDYTH